MAKGGLGSQNPTCPTPTSTPHRPSQQACTGRPSLLNQPPLLDADYALDPSAVNKRARPCKLRLPHNKATGLEHQQKNLRLPRAPLLFALPPPSFGASGSAHVEIELASDGGVGQARNGEAAEALGGLDLRTQGRSGGWVGGEASCLWQSGAARALSGRGRRMRGRQAGNTPPAGALVSFELRTTRGVGRHAPAACKSFGRTAG
jgi:hypothetical protein